MTVKIGEAIRGHRLRAGVTQEELAEALGVSSQAVSRWETAACYPDMETLPLLARYFGITIDELFGFPGDREEEIDRLVCRIRSMNADNNGRDVSMDECERLAREAAAAYPGNEKIMLCLASVLYNAGYVRRGEFHATGTDGFDYYDAERHQTYPEWREAILLYEKLLTILPEGDMRQQAVRELIQLYANTGEDDRAAAIAETCPPLEGCREYLLAYAHDGQKRAEYLGKLLLKLIGTAADQMVQLLISLNSSGDSPDFFIGVIENALSLFDAVVTDGEYGFFHETRARLYLFLSEFQWRAGQKDEAFASLDRALEHAEIYDRICRQPDFRYTAPILCCVSVKNSPREPESMAADLPRVWPWWQVPDFEDVRTEMQADPRWDDWVKRTGEVIENGIK